MLIILELKGGIDVEFLKKYGFYITVGVLALLLMINLGTLLTKQSIFGELQVYAKIAQEENKELKGELKSLKDLQSDLLEERKEIEADLELQSEAQEEASVSQQKSAETITKLMSEKEALLKKNYKNYSMYPSAELTEDVMYSALEVVKNKDVKAAYQAYFEEDYGLLHGKSEDYVVVAFDRFVAMYEVKKETIITHFYIVDVKENKLVASEDYGQQKIN